LVECRIRHRELVRVIDGSVAFNNVSIPVQPGISSTFPWLANLAANWENYRFNRIAFRFVSRSSTSFRGSVVMAPDYDASDLPPTSYQEMSSFQNAISDAPWKDILCILNPRSTSLVGNSRYVRLGNLGSNEDIKLYDVANFNIATVGQADASVVGELWAEYDIMLQIPQLQTQSNPTNISAGQYFTSDGIDVNHLLGTDVVAQDGTITITPVGNTVTLGNLDIGSWYFVNYIIDATTTLTTIPTITVVSGFDPVGEVIQSVTNTTTKAQMSYWELATSNVAVITLGGLTVVTGANGAYFSIAPFLHIIP